MKSEPKPPTFEQGVQTYTEMTMDIDVRTTGMTILGRIRSLFRDGHCKIVMHGDVLA